MEILHCVLFACALITVTHFIIYIKLKPSSKILPPRPKLPFPIIGGNHFDLCEKPRKSLVKLAETCGTIMSLKLDQQTVIAIPSSTMAKKILQNHDVFSSDCTVLDAISAHQHHEISLPWLPTSLAWAIGRDESTQESSNSFVPAERFMGSEIDVKGGDFELILFDAEQGICRGFSLTMRMRMSPLMLGSLINSFDWKLEDGVTPENMDMEDEFALILQKAQPFCVVPIPV